MAKQNGINILQVGNSPTALAMLDLVKLPEPKLHDLPECIQFKAHTIEEAGTYLKLKSFDVILLALDFTEITAFSSLERLHRTSPRTPIVVLSHPNFEKEASATLDCGASDFLTLEDLEPRLMARILRYTLSRQSGIDQALESSNIDSVTGLANRTGFINFIDRQLAEAERLQFHLSLFYIDCDNFKIINDTLGQQKGDDFLAHFGLHLKRCVRANDFVARLSADEFAVVINSKDNRIIPSAVVADKILQSVRCGIKLSSGEQVETHCSIGITHYTGETRAPHTDKFLHEANSALKESKKKGGDCTSFFDHSLGEKAERRIQLLKDTRIAFKRGEFSLHYQPIMEATTDRVRGYEALLRWFRKDGDSVSPAEFVPILEETGMIHIIGSWVIQQACQDFAKLLATKVVDTRSWISVNISPLQLQDPALVRRVKKILADTNMQAGNLHLEITESSLMENSESTFKTLAGLKMLGCKLSLDDFGVGYSSMNHLKLLPIDTLKIDQSFIRTFKNQESEQAIIRAMVSLAHNLGKTVVAEGIENEQAAAFLKQRRCEYLQGFLYAKPMAFDDVLAFTCTTNRLNIGLASRPPAMG